jgi:peptidoglycan/xylan/chitin deacetylase (PgdA/CDA1 family)
MKSFLRLLWLTPLFLAVVLPTQAGAAEPVKRVALVFDDGPRPQDAEPLLALLKQENVRVSFSLIGDNVKKNPATARAIAAAGHEINNHSQTHVHPKDLTDAALEREVGAAQEELTTVLGHAPRWYWPPYLEMNDRLRTAITHAGLTPYAPVNFVSSKDWDTSVGPAEIYQRATTDVRDCTVILFHEWRKETRQQLPAILAELRRQNCVFLTFSELYDGQAKK